MPADEELCRSRQIVSTLAMLFGVDSNLPTVNGYFPDVKGKYFNSNVVLTKISQ